jgi:hypothetical protein
VLVQQLIASLLQNAPNPFKCIFLNCELHQTVGGATVSGDLFAVTKRLLSTPHPALLYEVPQTREYVEGGHGYLEMFSTWPGDWKASIKHLVCEESKAVCVIDFAVGAESMTGISIFEVNDGVIAGVTDYWPEPYEPPPRATPLMKRRPE